LLAVVLVILLIGGVALSGFRSAQPEALTTLETTPQTQQSRAAMLNKRSPRRAVLLARTKPLHDGRGGRLDKLDVRPGDTVRAGHAGRAQYD
jgi:multidrug efflux pump subunit AcrA (membrane-fusion protein)